MTEQELKDKKAASDSAAFQQHFAKDVARYAREWTPSSASNTMPWNSNGLSSLAAAYLDDEVIEEREVLHEYAVSLAASFGLSGQAGLDAYNAVASEYSAYIEKGVAADPDLDPSSVISLDEFFSRFVSKG